MFVFLSGFCTFTGVLSILAMFKRKGDVRKCIPIYLVGALLIVCGLPIMIVGIVGQFEASDVMAYVGGISIFFGLGFVLMWHMFTIENVEKNTPVQEYDPNLKNIQDIVDKSRAKELSSSEGKQKESPGFSNLAFEMDKNTSPSVSTRKKSQETDGFPEENQEHQTSFSPNHEENQEQVKVDASSITSISSSLMGSQSEKRSGDSNSIPLEVA